MRCSPAQRRPRTGNTGAHIISQLSHLSLVTVPPSEVGHAVTGPDRARPNNQPTSCTPPRHGKSVSRQSHLCPPQHRCVSLSVSGPGRDWRRKWRCSGLSGARHLAAGLSRGEVGMEMSGAMSRQPAVIRSGELKHPQQPNMQWH